MRVKRKVFIYLFVIQNAIFSLVAQEIAYYKQKFDKYLDLNNQLGDIVTFYPDRIVLRDKKGNPEWTIYQDEITVISKMLEAEKLEALEKFFITKKNHHLTKHERDSILISVDEIYSFNKKNHLPLSGIRIAIDPGHFGYDFNTAKIEQRLLYFKHQIGERVDTIMLFEGQLTYLTAYVLAERLKEQGAEVLLTRNKVEHTAFGMSFHEWYQKRKNKVLDSLADAKQLSIEKYKQLKTCSKQQFFNLFFREYELLQRARIINNFNPHLSVIIHYNVDEKNSPWKKATGNNYSMCFIGGAFEKDNLEKTINKVHFLRLLLTDQIENSEKVSAFAIQGFENHLKVSAAKSDDASYLQKVCIPASKNGVFCRNLLLTRYIISPLVYGESMCQDNYMECQLLSEKNYAFQSEKIPHRVYEVADAYFQSIMKFFNEDCSQKYFSDRK